MPVADTDLRSISRGAVIAPAGCGKTHLIAETLKHHQAVKPVLVLTHTNAGVVALRLRLERAGVSSKSYVLSTIDGWAMRLISTFPARSSHLPKLLNLLNPGSDYPEIRRCAATLLADGHLNDILVASYARIIVDEYQDCSILQHTLVSWASQVIPTCVLGDPLQSIFSFGSDRLADWQGEVCTQFPIVMELTTPWRWINVEAEPIGQWLLQVRAALLSRRPVDLRTAPEAVEWIHLDGANDHHRRLQAARVLPPVKDGSVLIIGDSTNPESQRNFASQTPGAVTVEAVDLKDLVTFAKDFDISRTDALPRLIHFAQRVMTNVGAADLLRRVECLSRGTARKAPSVVEECALSFLKTPSHTAAVDLLVEINKDSAVRSFRPAVLRACIKAFQLSDGNSSMSFYDAAIRMREQNRFVGRPLPKRAVGSTLLLKGLESDVCVILNASALDSRNLYVALTRGSRKLVICSPTPVLSPLS